MPDRKSSALVLGLIYGSGAIFLCVNAWTCQSPTNVTLTKSMLDDLKNQIKNKILNQIDTNFDGNRFMKLVPGFVRLPFHSCSAKWCSSFINLTDPGNSGLQHVVATADGLHAALQRDPKYIGFSKADLYALCGVTALEVATGGRIKVNFRYGRPDFCPPRDNVNSLGLQLPPTTMDTANTYAFMRKVFNFTPRETATIMGAHSLGVLRDSDGRPLWRWANTQPDNLTNNYYQLLRDNHWNQANRPVPGNGDTFMQWIIAESPRLIMLNTDFGLARNIISIDGIGTSSCKTSASCAEAPTWSTIDEYANNLIKFLNDFSIVFGKMIENGLIGKLRGVNA